MGGDECSVCLDPPVHPVSLPCGHIFCYLCAKGLGAGFGAAKLCSLCRRPIPTGFLESAEVLSKASQELNDTPPVDATEQQWQWFYEGRNGWWRFESRNNEDLEEAFRGGKQQDQERPKECPMQGSGRLGKIQLAVKFKLVYVQSSVIIVAVKTFK